MKPIEEFINKWTCRDLVQIKVKNDNWKVLKNFINSNQYFAIPEGIISKNFCSLKGIHIVKLYDETRQYAKVSDTINKLYDGGFEIKNE